MFRFGNHVKIPLGVDLKMEEYFNSPERYNRNHRKIEEKQVKLIDFKDNVFESQFRQESGNKEERSNRTANESKPSGMVYIFPSVTY